jgi:hypothetical protein
MHVGRASEIIEMTDFENFYRDLKIEKDLNNDVVKIFGQRITSLARAQNGLNDVTELAYTTAEHHPYWNLIYNCSEIANSVLDKWHESLSEDDFSDIEWAIKELNQTLEQIKKRNHPDS